MVSYEVLSHLSGYDSGKIKKISWDNMAAPFLIGGMARSLASTMLFPINLVRMRLQMKTYTKEEMSDKNLKGQGNSIIKIKSILISKIHLGSSKIVKKYNYQTLQGLKALKIWLKIRRSDYIALCTKFCFSTNQSCDKFSKVTWK